MSQKSVDISKFDFVRLTWSDTNGIARCKIVPNHGFDSSVKSIGVGMCSLATVFDATTTPAPYDKVFNVGCPDEYIVPQLETLHECPWGGPPSEKIGQVLCQFAKKSPNLDANPVDSRYVCKKLLSELESEFGLKLWSALEYEFVLATEGRKPVFEGTHIYSPIVLNPHAALLFEISHRLKDANIFVETINAEYGDGQFEVTVRPGTGIAGPDSAFLMKQCVKETALEKGLEASFMCNPWGRVQSGGHFNFSLWRENINVFTDKTEDLQLSKYAKSWIAGIFEHIGAISALVCPTNNCFTRFFEGGFAPANVCYAAEHRGSCIRVKHSLSSGTFLEFRSSGAAANPYIVTSAIVAAGLDGMRRDLQPPPSGFDDSKKLPSCLKDALIALEKDDVLRKSLGEEFVECYLTLKRGRDLARATMEEQVQAYWKLI